MTANLRVAGLEFLLNLLVANLVGAGVLLIWEALLRPQRVRLLLIVLSGLVFIPVFLQIATGYFFSFDAGEATARVLVVPAYLVLMALAASGRKVRWRLNQIVGVLGASIPILIVAISPEAILVGIIVIFGFYGHKPVFEGRISPGLSYRVSADRPSPGSDDYRYTLFRNPIWLPQVRKQISDGAIDYCPYPAEQVSIRAGSKIGFVSIVCEESYADVLSAEIPVDGSIPAVTVSAPGPAATVRRN